MSKVKLNKNHGGKEFSNKFHFVGKVSPVQRKEQDSDNWFDVEFYEETLTKTKKPRRVVQFQLETAPYNRLRLDLSGMEMEYAYLYSRTDKKTQRIDFKDRFDKSKYSNETYHLIATDWDKTEEVGKKLDDGIWVDVRGHYEFEEFVNDDGEKIKLVKRVIDRLTPLKNGLVEIKGVKEGDTYRINSTEEGDTFLGQGKVNKEGIVSIRVGWLNEKGGELFVSKVDANGQETKRFKVEYGNDVTETDKIIVKNNLIDSSVRVDKNGGGYEYVDYVLDFNSEDFKEINSFEMQIGIRSTYQDEETKNTKVNAVYLDYGKERSTPKDVELQVYYKEPQKEDEKPLANAFANLNPLDFMTVAGIDNDRAETELIEVEEAEDDNPFADVGDKTVSYERVTTGTRKGLEILSYVTGTYVKEMLSEEEINEITIDIGDDPFGSVEIDDSELPF